MDHDERCNQQDRELVAVKARLDAIQEQLEMVREHDQKLVALGVQYDNITEDLKSIVVRIQLLVDQYHERNQLLATQTQTLSHLVDDTKEIKTLLSGDKFALQSEFLTVRNQLWAGIGIIVTTFLGAMVWFALKGGFQVVAK